MAVQQLGNERTIAYTDGPELVMERIFDAPRELVWKVITTRADHRTGGAPGHKMTVVENDVRVGGRWRWISPVGGEDVPFTGEYLEVVPPERVVRTEMFDVPPFDLDGPAIETMTLEDLGGRTEARLAEPVPVGRGPPGRPLDRHDRRRARQSYDRLAEEIALGPNLGDPVFAGPHHYDAGGLCVSRYAGRPFRNTCNCPTGPVGFLRDRPSNLPDMCSRRRPCRAKKDGSGCRSQRVACSPEQTPVDQGPASRRRRRRFRFLRLMRRVAVDPPPDPPADHHDKQRDEPDDGDERAPGSASLQPGELRGRLDDPDTTIVDVRPLPPTTAGA